MAVSTMSLMASNQRAKAFGVVDVGFEGEFHAGAGVGVCRNVLARAVKIVVSCSVPVRCVLRRR